MGRGGGEAQGVADPKKAMHQKITFVGFVTPLGCWVVY
jgi:hypothetical protein